MTRHLICPDVSEFQVPLDQTYTRDFVIFRVMFGAHYLDPKFLRNAGAAKRLYDEGRIAGVLLYVVYTADPVREQFASTWRAIGPRIPPWLTGIMIDVETWRGKSYELSGDHSKRINRLYGLHAHRLRNWNSVIAYGNTGDLQGLYSGRDKRCRVIVASYGSSLGYRNVRGAIGQQYSDGQPRYPVPRLAGTRLPRHSAPFGQCDHNVFPGIANGRELVRLLRPEQLAPTTGTPKRPRVAVPVAKKRKPAVAPTRVPAPARTPTRPVQVPAPQPTTAKKALTSVASEPHAIVSPNGKHALVVRNDGSLEVQHRIDPSTVDHEGP